MFDGSATAPYADSMLAPRCRAILWTPEDGSWQEVLRQAGCELRLARDESVAAEFKANWRPEAVFVHGLRPGECGRLRRSPPHLDLVYCVLLDRADLPQLEQPETDDFLVLPLSVPEVVVRVRLWRWRRERLSGGLLRAGPLAVDLTNLRVTVEGVPVELTYKEYELLTALLKRRGQVMTRDSILDAVWGPDYYGGERTVDVHIRRLRMKLPEIADLIVTVHGLGYRFERQ